MRKIQLKQRPTDRLAERFARELNEEQARAVSAPDGFNLILAGPGSGKTRVITYRVAHLIARGVPAASILLVTFTRRAAREMVGRLEVLVGSSALELWAGTFHHIGQRLVRRSADRLGYGPSFTIMDREDQLDFVRLAMDDAGFTGTDRMVPRAAHVLHLLSFAFNAQRGLSEVVNERRPELAEWLPQLEAARDAYAARKRAANCLDYDDLLGQWARLVHEFPEEREAQAQMFRHILVDEMQDTNALQAQLVETLARAGHGNLTAVGDDAQSIYRFRGAHYDNILKFPDRHPDARVFHLDVNYRSTPQIVAFTAASIARNATGFPKALVSARGAGLKPQVVAAADVYEEAAFVCEQVLEGREQGLRLNQMAVLYRSHQDSVVLQGELVERGIPYQVRSGLRFFEQAHIKDVLSYLRILANPRDELAWRRLLLLLPGIGTAYARAIVDHVLGSSDPLAALATRETIGKAPPKSRGFLAAFVADLQSIEEAKPATDPARAIAAIMRTGYPAALRSHYDNAEGRLADLEQLAVLAARYESLEQLLSELMLAEDAYGAQAARGEAPDEQLVLSTIHQAKGLEWPRVFILRLIDESFPSPRGLDDPEGEEEERRIFYVGISRAIDELTLTYPLAIARTARGSLVRTHQSRFLKEIDESLYEAAIIEAAPNFASASGSGVDAGAAALEGEGDDLDEA